MKAAIFDIDGTLIDSVDQHAKAWQLAFQHFGHDFSFEKIRFQIGKGGDQLMPVFLSPEEIDLRGKQIERYCGKLFRREFLPEIKPFPAVRELFERLFADDWQLALASSAKEEELKIYERLCQVGDLLSTGTSSDDAEKSKPHPDIFQAAMRNLGASPEQCIVIGDSPYDAEAAGKAGILSLGVRCGGFPEGELKAAGFSAIYQDPSDLLAHYDESLFAGLLAR